MDEYTDGEADLPPLSEWHKLQEQQTALFQVATTETESLRAKVKDLERELSVWKSAHSVISEEKDAIVKKASRLEQEIGRWTSDKPLVVALIDGDGHLFIQELFEMSQAGGRQAAMLLRERVFEYVTDKNPGITNRAELLLTVFWNAKGLKETLIRKNICTGDQFDGFCHGFNQSAHLFSIVDAGFGKEAADTKIKEHLRLFVHFPQTEFVFFGGGHDNGYTATLTSLETEGLLRKVVLIRGYSHLAQEIKNLNLSELSTTGIFMTKKLSSPFKNNSYPLPLDLSNFNSSSSNSDVISPTGTQSPLGDNNHLQMSPGKSRQQVIAARIPAKPCYLFYLHPLGCPKKNCRFAHDLELNDDMIETMRVYALRTPCIQANKGGQCTDKDCVWGHYCPNGPRCRWLLKPGGCKFRGAVMHSKSNQTWSKLPSLGLHSLSFGATEYEDSDFQAEEHSGWD